MFIWSKTGSAIPPPQSWVSMTCLSYSTQRQNECACSADLWFERESITNAPPQSPNSHLLPQYFFLLNKICNGGSSKEPFLKAATLPILILAYPRETKTNNGNFKNAAILPSKVAYRWRACALILPLCHPTQSNGEHAQTLYIWPQTTKTYRAKIESNAVTVR